MSNIQKKSSLQSHSVINSILTTVGIVVIVLFFFIPYITEYYTIQTVIKHSKNTAKQIKLTRAYYVNSVVDDVKKYATNLTFDYNHQGINGILPLPTTTIHDLSKIFSQKTGIKYNLYSQYPFTNRRDRNLTQFQKNAIRYTQESDEGIYIKRDYLDGQEVLRVATTDFMSDQSCVDCHNAHPNRTWEANKWKLNDKRGVLEVITPLDEELMGHKMMRNYIIAMIALAFGIVLFYLFLKMRQRENELIEVADNKDEKLNTIEGLLDQYVISSKTDLEGKITYASRAFIDISGYSYEELLGQPHSILKHEKMPQIVFEEMWSTITQKKTWRGEVLNRKKSGEGYWVDAIISPEYDKDNHHIGYNAIRIDITAQKEASYLAFHDDLTGLPNRIKFEEIASHAIDVAKRDKSLLAIMFVDLDRFKNINDTLGHLVGDELLKIVSQRMQYTLREVDTVARIGGDEFVILFETIHDTQTLASMAHDLLEELKQPISVDNHQLHITASIGISLFPDDGSNISELMKNADSAMYRAKEEGKNRYKFYTHEINEIICRKISVENAVREAIKRDGFDFVFQPKYDLRSHSSKSCEVLIRLTDSKLGFISPAEFIPIAEESTLINEIGEIVFEKACYYLNQWKDLELGIEGISINISSKQLSQKGIVDRFMEIINQVGVSAKSIELELTEHSLIENVDQNIKILNEFRAFGFKVAIDDFGTGYSSMGYLKKLPIDIIKIDKSFIDGIPDDSDDIAIVHSIIQLARNLNYELIVEGIENETQENILKELHCYCGQGFFFSKGLPNDEFIEFIHKS